MGLRLRASSASFASVALAALISQANAGIAVLSNGDAEIAVPRVCIQAADFPNRTITQIQDELRGRAMSAALGEIYGSVVKNSNDAGRTSAQPLVRAGILRPKGEPEFSNGTSFGEVCLKATYMVTKQDFSRMKPETVSIGERCFSGANITIQELKKTAIAETVASELKALNPKIAKVKPTSLLPLARNLNVGQERIDIGSGAYCANYAFDVIRLEIDTLTESDFADSAGGQPDGTGAQRLDLTAYPHGVAASKYGEGVVVNKNPDKVRGGPEISLQFFSNGYVNIADAFTLRDNFSFSYKIMLDKCVQIGFVFNDDNNNRIYFSACGPHDYLTNTSSNSYRFESGPLLSNKKSPEFFGKWSTINITKYSNSVNFSIEGTSAFSKNVSGPIKKIKMTSYSEGTQIGDLCMEDIK